MDRFPSKTVPLRLAFGFTCTLLLISHLAHPSEERMARELVIAGLALFASYYFTSAWYEARAGKSLRHRDESEDAYLPGVDDEDRQD